MFTLQTEIGLRGITGRRITDFLLNCTDEQYQRWWPGTHLRFHTIKRFAGDVGNIVFMDEFIGARRVKTRAVVTEAVAGRRLAWQIVKLFRLPVRFTLDLQDAHDQVQLTHTIRIGFTHFGKILDPIFRLYFSRRFAEAMDQHVHTEFPKLRDMLNG